MELTQELPSPGDIKPYERLRCWLANAGSALQAGCFEVRLPGVEPLLFGHGQPAFTIECHDDSAIAAILSRDEATIARAYLRGAIDLHGDMVKLYAFRNALTDRHWFSYLWEVLLQPLFFGQVKCDKRWIVKHYDIDSDFHLVFLDKKTRAYSQAIFQDPEEPLEDAMERKLEFALHSCRVGKGDRVLDIGGGWGAFTEYAAKRGVHVTSLTISEASERFLSELVKEQSLNAEVRREHFFEHRTQTRYDAIVNLGVTEHLPDYRRTLRHYAKLVKPGGRIYMDASACRQKYHFSDFITTYVYPGNASPMCFKEYIAEVEKSPLEIISVHNDRHNYELTARRWAANLDAAHGEIADCWGEELYRIYRLYLWGTAHAFASNLMSAYRIVLELPSTNSNLSRWSTGLE